MAFNCPKKAGLKLNAEKCSEGVQYLGHTITPGGLKPNSHNIDAVKDFPVSMNIKQLSFLTSLLITNLLFPNMLE